MASNVPTNVTRAADAPQSLSLVIDTDTYAGNFDRELCAACTGETDTDTNAVTDDPATDGARAIALSYDGPDLGRDHVNLVRRVAVGGRSRCLDLAVTPGPRREYNSLRIFLARAPTPEELDGILRRALSFAARGYELPGYLEPMPFRVLALRLERRDPTGKASATTLWEEGACGTDATLTQR